MKKKTLIPVIVVLIAVVFVSCGKQTDKEVIATELETMVETTAETIETTAEETAETVRTTAEETKKSEEVNEEETKTAETETTADMQDTKSANSESTSETTSNRSVNNESAPNNGLASTEGATGSAESVSDTTPTSSETVTPNISVNTPEPAPVQNPEPAPVQPESATTTPPVSPKVDPVQPEPVKTPEPAPVQTPAPTPVPEPVHEHTWKEHTATTQVWIPNIVVVEDYETQTISRNIYQCNCGYETDDKSANSQHGKNHVLAGEDSNFGIVSVTEEQQVLVGSHEEDQGHYEPSTYVDYHYCDCGATK